MDEKQTKMVEREKYIRDSGIEIERKEKEGEREREKEREGDKFCGKDSRAIERKRKTRDRLQGLD